MSSKSIRTAMLMVAAGLVAASAPALAQNWAGDGTSCRWPTFAAAIAGSAGAPIYLVSGHVFKEGGVVIPGSQEIHVGDASCAPNPGTAVAHAVISGDARTLDHLVVAAGDVLFDRVDVVDHITNQYGGNIDVRGGTLTLRNVVISGGQASAGGGLHSYTAALKLHGNDTRITGNTAGSGGGIKTYGADVHVTDGASVSANTAEDGGGLFLDGGGTLYLADRAAITDNVATSPTGLAGGAWLAGDSLDTSACVACAISHNVSSGYGGGLVVSGGASSVKLFNVSVKGNSAGSFGGGAVIAGLSGSPLTLLVSGATFASNTAGGNGGGLIVQGPGIARSSSVDTTTFSKNHAAGDGGGVFLQDATVELLNDELRENTADGSGAGLAVEEGGFATLLSVLDHDNVASGSGGGIFVSGASKVVSDQSWIHANAATQDGGGIALAASQRGWPTLIMKGGCDAAPGGGPLRADQYCSEVRNNAAGRKGGGLHLGAGKGTIDRTAFLQNTASVSAQAIALGDGKGPTLTLTNALVAEHTGNSTDVIVVGGGATLDAEQVTVTANGGAPVRYASAAMGHFWRSIVWDTSPFTVDGALSLDATCSSFGQPGGGSGLGGTGAVVGADVVTATDPSFVTLARGNYRLSWTSPSIYSPEIDACSAGSTTDLDGFARPVALVSGGFSTPYDRGAFERR